MSAETFDNVCSILFFFVVLPWALSQWGGK